MEKTLASRIFQYFLPLLPLLLLPLPLLLLLLLGQEYGRLLKDAGFEAVDAQDRTEQFTSILQSELERFTSLKEEFLKVTTWIRPTTPRVAAFILSIPLQHGTLV